MEKNSIDILVDQLEELGNKKSFLSGKISIEAEEWASIIHQLREAVPAEIREAEKMIQKKEEFVKETRREAEQIINDAKNYISEAAEKKQSQKLGQEAALLSQEAKKVAREIELGSLNYANQILEQLESSVQHILEIIRENRNELFEKLTSQEDRD